MRLRECGQAAMTAGSAGTVCPMWPRCRRARSIPGRAPSVFLDLQSWRLNFHAWPMSPSRSRSAALGGKTCIGLRSTVRGEGIR